MESRWLLRRVITRGPLLASAKSLSPAPNCAIRPFSNSSRLPAILPFPFTPTSTTTTTTNAPPTSGSAPRTAPESMDDIFRMVAKTVPGPTRRNFDSILPGEFSNSNAPPMPPKVVPRTGPEAGRSVTVTSDLPAALSRLRGILVSNNVKADQVRQRFHERPGLKKKRLKSARHRKRFKAGFKKLVSIAMDMKRKGL